MDCTESETRVRKLEFALARAICALELMEQNNALTLSFKRLIKDLKQELKEPKQNEEGGEKQ